MLAKFPAGVVAAAVASACYADVLPYELIDLGIVADSTVSINDHGVVAATDQQIGPVLWSNGQITPLGRSPSFIIGGVHDINNHGNSVGFERRSGATSAISWVGTQRHDLGLFGGTSSSAAGTNEAGHIVGEYELNGQTRAFFRTPNEFSDLGSLGGSWAWSTAVNGSDQVVGYSRTGSGTHAFLWESGQMVDLTPGTSLHSYANDVTEAGVVVGAAYISSNELGACIWVDKELLLLASPFDVPSNGDEARANAGNELGQYVGVARTHTGSPQAMLWMDGAVFNLNGLAILGAEGWDLKIAYDVNEAGQIVGTGTRNGVSHAFLLNPIPAPGVLVVLSLAGVIASRRRR